MRQIDYGSLADGLMPALMEAGRLQMKYYDGGVAVERKADQSPVTAADRDSEALLLAALSNLAPGVPVIAEEEASAGRVPNVGDAFFLVDPLDGTREFIGGSGEFTINIALVEDGVATFGVVYAPALQDMYLTPDSGVAARASVAPSSAVRGLADLTLLPIATRPPDPSGLVALASRSHQTPETEAFLARYPIAAYRQAGSSLKFCVIARGDADVYPRMGPTCEWDTAAGQAVLIAAGGCVVRADGTPLTYGKGDPRWLNPHFIAWGSSEPLPPTAA